MKKTLFFVIGSAASVVALLLSGCSKKDSGSEKYSMAAVSGTYKVTSATVNFMGQNQDVLPLMPDCQIDDLLQLKADSTFILIDAGTVCQPDDGATGKWYISGSYLIKVNQLDGKDTATIQNFTGTVLTLSVPTDIMGPTVPLTTNLTKQ